MIKINWCKLGLHNYIGYNEGLHKSFFRCKHCGKEKARIGSTHNR